MKRRDRILRSEIATLFKRLFYTNPKISISGNLLDDKELGVMQLISETNPFDKYERVAFVEFIKENKSVIGTTLQKYSKHRFYFSVKDLTISRVADNNIELI